MRRTSVRDAVGSNYAGNLIRRKATQLSRQRGFARHEAEDLESELRCKLLAALGEFDAERGHINAFVRTVIETAAAMIARERARIKRGGGMRPVSLDQSLAFRDDHAPTLTSQLTPRDLGRRLGLLPKASIPEHRVDEAIGTLPPRLQAICRGLMSDSASAVARELGVSRRQIRNGMEAIRDHFREAGLGEFLS